MCSCTERYITRSYILYLTYNETIISRTNFQSNILQAFPEFIFHQFELWISIHNKLIWSVIMRCGCVTSCTLLLLLYCYVDVYVSLVIFCGVYMDIVYLFCFEPDNWLTMDIMINVSCLAENVFSFAILFL